VRPIAIALSLIAMTAGCEQTNDPFLFGIGGSGGLSQAQASGGWSFTVHPSNALACSSGSLTDGAVVTAHLVVLADGTVSAQSFWQGPGSTTTLPATGTITLSSGVSDIFLASTSGSEMELRGTMTSAGSFTGTLTDPAPGFLPVFAACIYTTTGANAG
jgi:hypothetical protein